MVACRGLDRKVAWSGHTREATVTGAYWPASPTSKVNEGDPAATNFRRLPTTCPLVRETEPVDETYRTCEPVLMLPELRVSIPLTVVSRARMTPFGSLTVRLRNVVEEVPPTVCGPVPSRVTVPVPGTKAAVETLFVKSPRTANEVDIGCL